MLRLSLPKKVVEHHRHSALVFRELAIGRAKVEHERMGSARTHRALTARGRPVKAEIVWSVSSAHEQACARERANSAAFTCLRRNLGAHCIEAVQRTIVSKREENAGAPAAVLKTTVPGAQLARYVVVLRETELRKGLLIACRHGRRVRRSALRDAPTAHGGSLSARRGGLIF